MSSNMFRLLTVVVGVGIVVAGLLVVGAKELLVPVGVGVIGWGTPHPADALKKEE